MTEKEVQNEILLELNKYPNIRVWRQNTGVAVGLSQLMAVKYALQNRQYSLALRLLMSLIATKYGNKGMSDVQCIVAPTGQHVWFELKATGKLNDESTEQKAWGAMIVKYGGRYACVDSLELAESWLREWGII